MATDTAETICRPAVVDMRRRRVAAALLLNVGVTYRIGPRRLNVKLARQLARHGISSLRLDLGGIGDSAAAAGAADYKEQAREDLAAAMDAVTAATGIRKFMVLGICSGAVNGLRAAESDPRVVGLMMFDGYAFPTWRTRLVHDWQRLRTTSPRALGLKLMRRLARLFGHDLAGPPVSIFYATRDATAPDRAAFSQKMAMLVDRGVSVLIGYSGSLLAVHNHHRQFRDAFAGAPWLERVQCDYFPDIDHIPTAQQAQARFLAWVTDWASPLATSHMRQPAANAVAVVTPSVPPRVQVATH